MISKLDPLTLQALSSASQGVYIAADSLTSQEIADLLIHAFDHYRLETPFKTATWAPAVTYSDYFQLPLFLGCTCFAYAFFRSTNRLIMLLLTLIIPYGISAKNAGEKLYDSKHYAEAAEWYQSELAQAKERWLQDKLLYNLGLSLLEDHKPSEAMMSMLMISPDSTTHPLFETEILHTALLALEKAPRKPDDVLGTYFLMNRLNEMASSQEKGHSSAAKESASIAAYYLREIDDPISFLKYLLDLLAVIKRQYDLSMTPTIDIAEEAKRFFPIALQWQTTLFKQGRCQCQPWDRVLPLFSDGMSALKQGVDDPHSITAYLKWSAALFLLMEPSSNESMQQEQNYQTLSELQEMQSLDHEPTKQHAPLGEGMLW